MANRVIESTYWHSQQLPSVSPYNQHYQAATMSEMSQQQQQQQQPRQAPPPLNHSMHALNVSENQSVYAGSNTNQTSSTPSSSSNNGYHGQIYPTSANGNGAYSHASAMNGSIGNPGINHAVNSGMSGGMNGNNVIANGNGGTASQAMQVTHHAGYHHGGLSNSHGMLPLSATQMTSSPYPPVGASYPSYHLSHHGVYTRSYPGEGDNGMSQGFDGMHQLPGQSYGHHGGGGGGHHHHHVINNYHQASHQNQNHHQPQQQLSLPAIQPQPQQPQSQSQSQSQSQHAQQAALPPTLTPQQQQPPQSTFQESSQHSGSPTLDGSDCGQSGMKPKRRQVKNACINCQKACKRCDEGRPCTRCVKYGLEDTCQDSARKERKRGIKRGPYKRRATTGSQPNSATSMATSHFSQSSSFAHQENAMSSAPYLGHHSNSTPHLRSYKAEDSNGAGTPLSNNGQAIEEGMLNSPIYPSSAPNTVQRGTAPLYHSDSPYSRNGLTGGHDNFHQGMQPPRFTRFDYERSVNSPGLSSLNMMGHRSNALPPPISAPASSMTFSAGVINNGNNSRSLFSPPSFLGNNYNHGSSANFLGANGQHHRLNSDSSLNTLSTNTTQSSSQSPRTPMTLSANSSSGLTNSLDMIGGQPLSANSAMSSPGGLGTKFAGNGNNYIHHPGPTTTLNLPSTATGAFSNPPSTPSSNAAFPLHIPHSARWRIGNSGTNQSNGEYDSKEEQLAPIKLISSNDSDMSGGTISARYQLPSPRITELPRGVEMRPHMAKMEQGPNALPTGA